MALMNSGWKWRPSCSFVMAVLLSSLLESWSAAAPAQVGGAGPLASGSRGDAAIAAHAEIERMNVRIFPRRNSGALPRGYEKKLKIAVPQKPGFKAFVNATNQKVTGYCIDIFEAAVRKLPHDLDYEFEVYTGDYDQLVHNVSTGIFDAAVGDVTITAERASYVDFTMPYTESGVSLLVLTENDSSATLEWVFLKPLTKELWLATVGGFLFTGLVVWIFERPKNLEYQGSSWRQFSTALYFSLSTLTFSHDQIIRSPLSKTVVVIWCFVVLVLVQSYTASLSSILTAKRLRPSVTDLTQLLLNGDYVGYQHGSFIESVLTNQGFDGKRLRPYRTKEEYAEALRKGSKSGGVSAIVDEIPYITSFLSGSNQNEFQMEMVNRIYKTPGLGFVFPQGSPLVHNLSVAILDLTHGDESSQIEAKWLGTVAPLPSYAPNTDLTPLTLRRFSGLFVISGCASALMLLIRIARSIHDKYTRVRDSDKTDDESEGHGESSPSQTGVGTGSVADQPLREAINDDSQLVNGSGECVCGEEPSPMPNCTYNGPVPSHSIQIEVNSAEMFPTLPCSVDNC